MSSKGVVRMVRSVVGSVVWLEVGLEVWLEVKKQTKKEKKKKKAKLVRKSFFLIVSVKKKIGSGEKNYIGKFFFHPPNFESSQKSCPLG